MFKLVLADGVFDLLHVAHIRHLQQARTFGLLAVGVTRDAFVNKVGRPIFPEDERLEMIRSLACVYRAELVNDSLEALKLFAPAVFCKGSDYKAKGLLPEEYAFCAEHGIEIVHTEPNPQTTTSIIERIRCTS